MALVVKNLPANIGDVRKAGSIFGSGISSEGGNRNPLQYSCLENPMNNGAWGAIVYRIAKNWTQLKSLSLFTFMHRRKKWQPTPVFLPGESQGQRAWWAAVYGVAQSRIQLKWLSSSIIYSHTLFEFETAKWDDMQNIRLHFFMRGNMTLCLMTTWLEDYLVIPTVSLLKQKRIILE